MSASAWLALPLSTWYLNVMRTVEEPYLDEVFHVRQAQHFCQDHWNVWDPKITTPPGLYLLSYVFKPALGCSINGLRLINCICLMLLIFALNATYDVRRKMSGESGRTSRILAHHSALNIVLFPPLFFFSALYYTDVASTLSVVVFYWYFLRTKSKQRSTIFDASVQVLLGGISLLFRQTNIFWVAVFPAALTAIVELDQGHKVIKESMYRRAQGFGDSTYSVTKTSWKMGVIYDPPVRDAYIEDYFRTMVSIIACALKVAAQPDRILQLVRTFLPYIAILAGFASFIVWNGGVVLGDKSNHTVSINLPQMLYLWPLIAFFSWPLLLQHFMLLPLTLLARLQKFANLEPLLMFRNRNLILRWHILLGSTALANLVVYLNTVVHPFLLADNRHYHFYIFKRLLRPWWVRYAVTPIYVLTAWACLEARGGPTPAPSPSEMNPSKIAHEQSPGVTSDSTNSKRPLTLPDGTSTASVSFILICTFVTALSLCTAPLVEPRYCIIPYLIWRMHLPLYCIEAAPHRKGQEESTVLEAVKRTLKAYDWRVMAETIWFLAIIAVTGEMFLNHPFKWASEEGWQRFMW